MYFAAHARFFPVSLLPVQAGGRGAGGAGAGVTARARPRHSVRTLSSSCSCSRVRYGAALSSSPSVFNKLAKPSVAHQKSRSVRSLNVRWISTSSLCSRRFSLAGQKEIFISDFNNSSKDPYPDRPRSLRGKVLPFQHSLSLRVRPGPVQTNIKTKTFRLFSNSSVNFAMDLRKVVLLLDEFAPTNLAGSWDNVGLLVEPTPPHSVSRMCLANDLTEAVLAEAIEKKANFILSYHPPIFVPLKRLTMRKVKERIIVGAIENRIAIYSPHTCYDVVEGGVTDWLVEGLGDVKENRPLEASFQQNTPSGDDFRVSLLCPDPEVCSEIQKMAAANVVSCMATNSGTFEVNCTCKKSGLGEVMSLVQNMDGVDKQSVQIVGLSKAPMMKTGLGRIATLREQTATSTLVDRIKTHLQLSHVQIALGEGKTLDSQISTVAICAGSGASVLKGARADMYLTGEMSHHEILAAVAEGITVIVCNHSNTERGFLHVLQKQFTEMFDNEVEVFVSETDRDPFQVV